MKLTTFTDYGLRTLMYLAAKPDELCSVKEVAQNYKISQNHLVKVVHRLSQLGYIKTVKGKGGGIQIEQSAFNLKLGDLITQLEPNMHTVECFDPKSNTCNITNSCHLKHYLHEGTKAFTDTMNQYTLADTIIKNIFIDN